MINLSNQSTKRASLTKTKGLILASLIAGMMAVPFSAFAQFNQISAANCTYSITDNSPVSWTLEVNFTMAYLGAQGAFYFADSDATVVNPPPGFQPFYIGAGTNGWSNYSGVHVYFFSSAGFGAYSLYNDTVSGIPTGMFPIPHVPGTATTIAGFLEDATVTLSRQTMSATSPVTITVTFRNDPFVLVNPDINAAINLINLWNFPGSNGLNAKLNFVQTKIGDGNSTAACGGLNAFINQVGAEIANGHLTLAQGAQLLGLAAAIQFWIPGC